MVKLSAELALSLSIIPAMLALYMSPWFWVPTALMLSWPLIVAKVIWNLPLKGQASWSLVKIDDYVGSMPMRVRTLVMYIRDVLPTADLRVDQLVQDETIVDPFLVLRRSGVDYYIAVWDEDDFSR